MTLKNYKTKPMSKVLWVVMSVNYSYVKVLLITY